MPTQKPRVNSLLEGPGILTASLSFLAGMNRSIESISLKKRRIGQPGQPGPIQRDTGGFGDARPTSPRPRPVRCTRGTVGDGELRGGGCHLGALQEEGIQPYPLSGRNEALGVQGSGTRPERGRRDASQWASGVRDQT